MASLTTRPNNTRELRTVPRLGRKAIRLGHCTLKQARAVNAHVDHLEAQAITGHPAPDATQRWLREIDRVLYDRLVRAGLVEGRRHYTLGEWIAERITQTEKTAVAGTITRLRQSEKAALAHFGKDKNMAAIHVGDCEDYAAKMHASSIAKATACKRLGDLKQWLGKAVKHSLIDSNPMESIPTTVPPTEHHAYISDEKAIAVMAELTSPVQRAAFALSRWGGLRSFSEHARLKWSDIDWHRERFTVHGKGGVVRQCPIFPELVGPLHDLYEQTAEGETMVFPGMVADSAYLRRQIERAIKAANLKQWPRLFHNLRASRQTDLIDRMGMDKIKTICSWLGNSPGEAIRSYMIERGREKAFREMSATGAAATYAPFGGDNIADQQKRPLPAEKSPAPNRAAKSAASLGRNGDQRGSKNPATGTKKAGGGVQCDPYGILRWGRGASTDNYLQAYKNRRASISAAVQN